MTPNLSSTSAREPARLADALPGRTAWARAICLVAAALLANAANAAPRAVAEEQASLRFMTQNLYVGDDLGRIMQLDPTDPYFGAKLVQAVTTTYYGILSSQPPARLNALAAEIAREHPDVVTLNEVSLLRIQSPGDAIAGGTTPATEVVMDYLELLLQSLEARGVHYAVASSVQEMDIEMPMLNPFRSTPTSPYFEDARLTDRDVLLVRADLPPGHLRVANPQSGNYAAAIPVFGMHLLRGWCSVDLFSRGQRVRLIATHLEEETAPAVQLAQIEELLAGPGSTSLPVILMGDLNSDAYGNNGTLTYAELMQAGFTDPWKVLYPHRQVLTWGHDSALADPSVPFVWRIDFILHRGPGVRPRAAAVFDPVIGSQPPLWISDHAGVITDLTLGGPTPPRAPMD